VTATERELDGFVAPRRRSFRPRLDALLARMTALGDDERAAVRAWLDARGWTWLALNRLTDEEADELDSFLTGRGW
jgi:hypothetical protein